MPILDSIDGSHLYYGLAGCLTCLFAYKVWVWPHLLSPLRKIPGPPLGNIIFGQFFNIMRSEVGTNEKEWVERYGPIVRVVGAFGSESLIFVKPEALRKILVRDWLQYPMASFVLKIMRLTTGYGLITATGDTHKHMRKTMNPAFALPNLISKSSLYLETVESLVNIFNGIVGNEDPTSGAIIHVHEWMNRVALDIVCETSFGYKADSLHNPNNELLKAYELLTKLQSGTNMAKMVFVVSLPGVADFLGSNWAYEHRHFISRIPVISALGDFIDSIYQIRQLSRRILTERKKDVHISLTNMESKQDVGSILLSAWQLEQEGKKGEYTMSERDMMDHVMTFIGAGHESTTSSLTWTLWLLAKNPECQQRLRAELEPIFADSSRPEYSELSQLHWLDGVVMESLRLMPPVPVIWREAAKTDYIDGVLVPKGTLLPIVTPVVNCYKGTWGEDADEFNPARWSNLPEEYQSSLSFSTFNAGPHGCIGKTMSIEIKMVVSYLIYNFEFEPSFVGQTAQTTAAVTIRASDGMPLRVKPITRA